VTTVAKWTGREARLLRESCRLSVRAFAEYLGIPARTLSKWEQLGVGRTPRPEFQAMLDTALARAAPEQRERFLAAAGWAESRDAGQPAPPPTSVPPELEPTAPRWLPRLGVGELRVLATVLQEAAGRHEAELVPYFTSQLVQRQAQDGSLGPVQALPATLGLIAAIETSARRVSSPVRLGLLCLAARGSEFVGWLYRDAGAFDQATYWYDRGTEWAQEAGNAQLQGYVLLRRSQMAYDFRDGLRVKTLADAARAGPWDLPTRVRAEVAQQQALGLAMTGHSPDDVERQLDQAHALLDASPADDEASALLGASFTKATLKLRGAACYAEAGRPSVAEQLLAEVLAAGALSHRDAGYFRARRSAALAACAEPDVAAEVALSAMPAVTATGSMRTRRVLSEVAGRLEPWDRRPVVRTFREAVGL
jgi:transcriptional regulator with XRE-family HTH domain